MIELICEDVIFVFTHGLHRIEGYLCKHIPWDRWSARVEHPLAQATLFDHSLTSYIIC